MSRDRLPALQTMIQHDAFTHGATSAFTVAALIVTVAALIIVTLLRVRHQQLSTDTVGVGPA